MKLQLQFRPAQLQLINLGIKRQLKITQSKEFQPFINLDKKRKSLTVFTKIDKTVTEVICYSFVKKNDSNFEIFIKITTTKETISIPYIAFEITETIFNILPDKKQFFNDFFNLDKEKSLKITIEEVKGNSTNEKNTNLRAGKAITTNEGDSAP